MVFSADMPRPASTATPPAPPAAPILPHPSGSSPSATSTELAAGAEEGKMGGMPIDILEQLHRQLVAVVEAEGLSNAELGRRCRPAISGQRVGQIINHGAKTVELYERLFTALQADVVVTVTPQTR